MLAAAREAIRNTQVAVAPCSGFHHARYGSTAGFCTFNGLMVAALALQAYGEATEAVAELTVTRYWETRTL